jgi:hypothetical protein
MTHVKAMLDTYPGTFDVDADRLAATIEALISCANTCTQCADACLSEENVAEMVKCIHRNLDCADVCVATSRVLSRQTAYDRSVTRSLLETCIAACRSCGDECDAHGQHMEHCRICATACRSCEQACQDMLAAM